MATKEKPSVYSVLLNEMRDEMSHLISVQLNENDDRSVDKLQAKWNAIVNCCSKWIQIAENRLYNPYLKDKFKKESKKELINKGIVIITELNALSCKNSKAKFKKRELLEELDDRIRYIRSNY